MIDEIMAEARTAMQKSVIALQNEMATVRTGRANAHCWIKFGLSNTARRCRSIRSLQWGVQNRV